MLSKYTKDRISLLNWYYINSLIMNSDKNEYVYEPKRNKEVLHIKAHDSKRSWMKVKKLK